MGGGGEVAIEGGRGDATIHENVAAGDERAIGTHQERADDADLVGFRPGPIVGELTLADEALRLVASWAATPALG